MDGEHRIGDSAWPATRTSRQTPAGPEADADATHAYPGSFAGDGGSAAGGQGFVGGPPPAAPTSRSGSDTVTFDAATRAGYGEPGRYHDPADYPHAERSQAGYPQGGYPHDGYGPGSGFGPGGVGSPAGPGLHGQDRFDPGGPARGGSGGPSRRVVFTSLGVAALLAIGAGVVYSMTRPNNVDATVTPTASSGAASPSAASALPPTTAATASVTVTVTTTTRAAPASGAPTGYVEDPWSDPDMDFGTVVKVRHQGDKAQITVRRQHFLTGDAATEYYDAHPDKERMDYAITDDGGKNKQYTVADDALVYGSNLLGDGPDSHTRLTASTFATKAKTLLDNDTPLRMWMSRRSSSSKTVVYLAEQYIP